MPIDSSIYQNIKPVEIPSMLESQQKAMNLSQLALQNRNLVQQSDLQKQAADAAAYKRKTSAVGSALDSLAGMTPDQRTEAYPQVRDQLVKNGFIKPDEAPEEYDESFFRPTYLAYKNSSDYLEGQKTKSEVAKNYAEAFKDRMASKQPNKDLSPGEKMADEAFGKDAAEYYYGGGKASTEKNIARLQGAIEKLNSNKDLTSGWTTKIPGLSSDSAQDVINPELASVRDDIRAAIQGSLRQVLGPQFTEKEGEAIFNRAFNPRLSTEENVRRATAELDSIKRMAASKDQAMANFKVAGTLKGYSPSGTMVAGGGSGPNANSSNGGPNLSGGQNAYAAPPPDSVKMMGPDGKVRMVPREMVGEAIASGGKRVQ